MATEPVFLPEEVPYEADVLDMVEGVAGLRVLGVADLDAGFELAGIVVLEPGVEEREVALEGVEDLDTGFELEVHDVALEGVEDLT